MKKNIFYLSILLFFIFIFTIFYIGLDKPNFYKPKDVKIKNLEEFTSTGLFSNKQKSLSMNHSYYNSNKLKEYLIILFLLFNFDTSKIVGF